ncbi:serine-rich adhesin for platelets-like isoform X2 [Mytilus edulis]|uniref:serine-rich adhesin for platelets-like isoform X2 n=1 Tax=Mytilus edulis TaxID=6550 RepID=UPI0039EEFCB0
MDNMEGPLPPGKQGGPNWYDTLDRHQSVQFSAKGLRNAPGENNCFLNSAVQVFWHLDVFRRSYRRLTGHLCMGNSCIFCALKVIFTQYQYSDQSSLPPDALRKALAETFMNKQRFQLGHMDDAAECFENILRRIHFHVANAYHEDSCSAPHCLPHQKFAMTVFDQLVCICGASSDPLTFHELVHYISTTSLLTHCRSMQETGDVLHPDRFGLLLRNAGTAGDIRDCPGNCGKRVQIRRTLLNTPDVVSIGLVWDSDRPDEKLIREVAKSIGTTILLQDMFHSVVCKDATKLPKLQLSALVCYYGKHYSTIVYHTKLNVWIYFDDATVTEIGPRWENVVDKCSKGRFQPLLLLYSNHNASPIATETAPKKRVMAPGYATTPSKGVQEKKRQENDGHKPSRRSLTPNPDKIEISQSNGRRAITPGPDELSPGLNGPQKMNIDHHRQSSFLIAVTGKTDKSRQYSSEYAVPKGINPIKQSVPGGGQSDMSQRQGMLKHCFYEPSNAEKQQFQQKSNQDAVDGYDYTLSSGDQYRRPAITAPKPNNLPIQVNFARVNDCQRKESFKKGKDKVRADVIRSLDPSRRESQSSDSDSPQTPPLLPPQLPPKISRSQSCHNYDLESSPANVSADNIDIRQHVVMKPRPSNSHAYENLENSSHTPVQSGLATLPRNKKSNSSVQSQNQHSRQNSLKSNDGYPPHNRPTSGQDMNNMYHTVGYSQQVSHSRESSSNTIVPDDVHSRQNSLASQISDNSQHSLSSWQQGSNNQSVSQYRNQPSVSSNQRLPEDKPPKPAKPEKKINTVAAQKKKSMNSKGQQPPPLPEKKGSQLCNVSPNHDQGYINRKTVENILSYQKLSSLSRQGSTNSNMSCASISSNASTTSNTSFESDNCSLSSKEGNIPFDRLSLDSRQDSGYSGSDRNSSSSTGSTTLDPYTQYFLSKSMIPPKTFNQQAVAENIKKFIDPGFCENQRFDQKYTVGYQTNSFHGNQQQQNQHYQRGYEQSGDRKQLYDPAIVKSHQSKDTMGYPMHQNLDPNNQERNPKNCDNQMFIQSGPPGYDEVVSFNIEEFASLCHKSEDLMDQCMLYETDSNCHQAIQLCNSAIDCLKQAMKMTNITHQSFQFAQMKHNSCILKLRSLQKKNMFRQESNSSTNSSDSARSSPCGLPNSSSNIQYPPQQSSQNVVHSRSSSRDSIDSVIENKNYRKDKVINEIDGQKMIHSNSSHSLNERTCSSNVDTSNVDMYATLPRKGRQLAMKNQNSQNTELFKNCLNRQQRTNSPSLHQPSSRSSTPSSECRDSDSSSQASDQYRMQIPSHQQVKMNKAEIRQLPHNSMVQRQGNQQSNGGMVSQNQQHGKPLPEKSMELPLQQFNQRVQNLPEQKSDNEDVRPSVKALASRFDRSGRGKAKANKQLPPMNSNLDNRHRSKSESDFLRMDSKPKSVLSKRKKCKASRPRKSVTFSENIAMVSAADLYATDTDMCSGYVSDSDEKYKYQRGAYSDNELEDDDSNSTESPADIHPGQSCCCLCNKHGCAEGSQFCAKCQLYMSRFQPSEC